MYDHFVSVTGIKYESYKYNLKYDHFDSTRITGMKHFVC